jgi:hypothetical protein
VASKRNILQSVILSGVDPTTGEYLSPAQRKAIFRKRNISSERVFGKPGALIKVAPSKIAPGVQPLAEPSGALVKRINILENQVSFLTKSIEKEAEVEKQTQKEFERTLVKEDEKKARAGKEKKLENGLGKLLKPLLAPVKALGSKTKGFLDTILDFFGILFAGWLTDKGLNAIRAHILGDEGELESIGVEVGKALGAVVATLSIINGSLFTIIGIAGAITGALISAPFKLLWKGLKGLKGLVSPKTPPVVTPKPPAPTGSGGGPGSPTGPRGKKTPAGIGDAADAARKKLAQEVLDKGLSSKGAIINGKYVSVTSEEATKLLAPAKKPGFFQRIGQGLSSFAGMAKDKIMEQLRKMVDPVIKPISGAAKGIANKVLNAVKKLPVFPQIVGFLKKQGINAAGGLSKLGSSAAGKLGAKALPFIGGIANLLFAYDRLANGDSFGAALETISGIMDFAGAWPLSLGLDAFLFARDYVPGIKEKENSIFAGMGLDKAKGFLDNLGGKLPNLGEVYKMVTGKNAEQPKPSGDVQLTAPKREDFAPGRDGEGAFKKAQREYNAQLASKPTPAASPAAPPPSPTPQITPPSSPSFIPGPAAAAQPQIIYKRVPSSAQGQGSPLKSGSATDVPSIPSSNPDNFYTLYSQMNYNVVT